MAEQYSMTINGKPVKGSKTVGVINPATGKVFDPFTGLPLMVIEYCSAILECCC